MINVLLICKKELKSYFASPIAYILMAFFGLIFGFGCYTATRDMMNFTFRSQNLVFGGTSASKRSNAALRRACRRC